MGKGARGYRMDPRRDSEALKADVSAAFPGLIVQTADPAVASKESLIEMFAAQTIRAAQTGALLARKAELDLLLRAAGTTQISEAIQKAGARPGQQFLLVVAGEEKDLQALESGKFALGARLPKGELTRDDFVRVEKAALLSAMRA